MELTSSFLMLKIMGLQMLFQIYEYNATWCLGSQYWCKNPTMENYQPKFGILLDMVGAEKQFYKEGVSVQYANHQLKAF